MISATPSGVELRVRVIPRAGTSKVVGIRDGSLLIRLAAPPVEGAANDALIRLLSEQLKCPRRAVLLVSGEHSRSKRVRVDGVTADDIRRLLGGGGDR